MIKTPEELAKEAAEAAFNSALSAIPMPAGPGFPAARVGDNHICPMVDGIKPHVGGPVAKGCPTVLIANMPAARAGDIATCVGPPDSIAKGSATVLIGGQPAARMMVDTTAHGGVIVVGCPNVLIGG